VHPILLTPRLRLRPFTMDDVADLARIINDREIAANTLTIPYPYDEEAGRAWIATHADGVERHSPVVYAVTRRTDGALIGATGLALVPEHRRAELGYWIARAAWGEGYATEAAAALLEYGFEKLGLERIHAAYFPRNPASGRVLEKLGMRHEGTLRSHLVKWGVPEDLSIHGIMREEFTPWRARSEG